jgi:phage terminase large subunit
MSAAAQHVRRAYTPFGALAAVARRAANDGGVVRWPFTKWRDDPVGFARDVLGVELWSAQVQILESIRDNRNTTVRSGHKIGKSTALAVAALWFYSSFDRARVLITAVKASQVDEAIWKEVRRLYRQATIPLGGTIHELARSGLRDTEDGRQIWGITARDGEGLAGISGANILILADEASGIRDRFFEVLGSSLAGSGGIARKCYISNPTRTTGEFYLSHTRLAQTLDATGKPMFKCLAFSSEETPNARGEKIIPGLAGPEWIAEKKLEYGEDSPAYRVRVKGEFVHDKDGKIISLDLLALAELAWDETPEEGDLQLGIDPAGDGVLGDETAIAVRIGRKVITVLPWRALTEDQVVEHAVAMLAEYRPRATSTGVPRIAIDVEGGIGTRVCEKLRVVVDAAHISVEIVPVRSGKKLWGSPEFDKVRDGLWGQARNFLRAGGAIPTDVKLNQELNAPSFTADANQRYVATDKKILRKELGRSPDRADAVCLAIWGFESIEVDAPPPPAGTKPTGASGDVYEHAETNIDAYDIDGLGVVSDGVYS